VGSLHQGRDLGAREILWATEQPGTLVVENEHRAVVDGVAAGDRAADDVRHDIAAAGLGPVAGLIR